MLTEFFTAVIGGGYLLGKYLKNDMDAARYQSEQIAWEIETAKFVKTYTNEELEKTILDKINRMLYRDISSFIDDFAGEEYDKYLCEFANMKSKDLCKNVKNTLRVMLAQEGYIPTMEAADLFRARLRMLNPEALLYYYAVKELKKKRPEFGYIFVLHKINTQYHSDLFEFFPEKMKYDQYSLTGHFGFGTRLDPPLW